MLARHYTTGGYAAAIFPLGEYGPFTILLTLPTFMVLWFGPSTFQNLAIHVSTVRCQYEESSCRASVPTSPRNLESFSVHQIVDPYVEITLFQKANQTQPLHNSTLKMKSLFSISYQNVFSAHFRGFVAFVVLWFGLSKFQNLTVRVSIVRCQDE